MGNKLYNVCQWNMTYKWQKQDKQKQQKWWGEQKRTMVVGWPCLDSYTNLSLAGWERQNIKKGLWIMIRPGQDHTPITVIGKTDTEISLIYCQLN